MWPFKVEVAGRELFKKVMEVEVSNVENAEEGLMIVTTWENMNNNVNSNKAKNYLQALQVKVFKNKELLKKKPWLLSTKEELKN